MTDTMDDPLVDAPLVANLDADQELSGERAEALSDDEIRGARVRLLRKTIEKSRAATTSPSRSPPNSIRRPARGLPMRPSRCASPGPRARG